MHLPVADDLIDIHVALSPGASLPDDEGKVIIQFTIMNLSSNRETHSMLILCIAQTQVKRTAQND